jgi:RNA polymerase sigma-70 factor (ECF subfamily)
MMPVCMRYTQTQEEAAEILNDSFLKLFKMMRDGVEIEKSLPALIKRIVVNTAIDYYRKNRKHHETNELQSEQYQEPDQQDILDQLAAEEIITLIQRLPLTMRTVFNLHVLEGYPHCQIAEQMGISEGTSRSYLAKARSKLQKQVGRIYPQFQPSRHAKRVG